MLVEIRELAPQEVSICGAVDLLATIFGEDGDILRLKYGVPLKKHKFLCMNCGKPSKRVFCSRKCHDKYAWIPLVCPECGIIFKRRGNEIIYRFNHPQRGNNKNQERIFCSQKCKGKNISRNYGFGVHPENVRENRKWDYSLVAQVRYETGWGCCKLGRALSIPASTISIILAKQKEQTND